jgi:molybdenum-dependent DNA-binding transcriptional regulator ModE
LAVEQLGSIQQASKDILEGSHKILRASEDQNSGIKQINQSIQLINQSSQENAMSAEEASSNSLSLTELGEKLSHAVNNLEMLVYGKVGSAVRNDETSEGQAERSGREKVIEMPKAKLQMLKATGTEGQTQRVVVEDSDAWENL